MSNGQKHRRILLIGWDAADWRVINPLLEAGKMPALESLINRGVMGNLATIRPMLSPMLWTSIATGKRAFKHGIHGFAEPTADGGGIQPISNLSRKAKAFWNIFNQSGMTGNVVGWWPSNPAEPIRGTMVSNLFQMVASHDPSEPWPLRPGSVHPRHLMNTLAELRFHPTELHENQIRPFIPHADEVDQEVDSRMGVCAKMLSECTTVHAVATHLAQTELWDYMAVYYDAIDHFCHGFMKYHPPQQEHVSDTDFRLYSNVVEAAYRYHDMMLATWLSLVGPETTIVLLSDHGFHPDHLRLQQIPSEPAAPAAEHRDLGILVMAGPDIKRDERIYGATLLDICPTLLAVAGLPIADDMDGIPLFQAFKSQIDIERIPSWEDIPGDTGQHPSEATLNPQESQQAIEQLVELGYIEKPAEDVQDAIQQVLRELKYNLAQSYMDADLHQDAIEILEVLHSESPNDNRFMLRMALCYQALDDIDKLELLVEKMKQASAELSKQSVIKLVDQVQIVVQRVFTEHSEKNAESSESPPAETLESSTQLADPVSTETNGDVKSNEDWSALNDFIASLKKKDDQPSREGCLNEDTPESLPLKKVIELANDEEKQKIHKLVAAVRSNPYSFDYLEGYVELAKGHIETALEFFRRAEQAEPLRPWLPIQIGEAYLQLKKWADAEQSFLRALQMDDENAYAFAGLARSYLGRRMNQEAANAAINAVGILHHYAFAHYLLGIALHRLGKVKRAVQAFEMAVTINPNFAEAHRRLALIEEKSLGNTPKAKEHRKLARRGYFSSLRNRPNVLPKPVFGIACPGQKAGGSTNGFSHVIENRLALRPDINLNNIVTVVSGLPRSGTSMMMQMLGAGGLQLLSDEERKPDKDNPRGYFEYEAVRRLQSETSWIGKARGKCVKVIAQLLPSLPEGRYRLIFMDRDLDEVISSQRRMLQRVGKDGAVLSDEQLKNTYAKQVSILGKLLKRSRIPVLLVNHRQCVEQPHIVADEVNRFLGGRLDTTAMVHAVDPRLYRHRVDSLCEMKS
ncbi:alkaline phosphatase family protein [Bythopirellula goksoeyrii]|uniref:Cellulose synthase subunit BcsC n=1 Tax=Bythopirellula goksoeyrii TaxID=1400387 RepID=A0A5B9Q4F7_9BACT|nr:alkaline phosphatase family protein [Bythopirellula goksoeyrii]QEG33904.1 cellulose synthase subunit BcsC [Bythopirellula goksoeyrii]